MGGVGRVLLCDAREGGPLERAGVRKKEPAPGMAHAQESAPGAILAVFSRKVWGPGQRRDSQP